MKPCPACGHPWWWHDRDGCVFTPGPRCRCHAQPEAPAEAKARVDVEVKGDRL